MIEINFNKKKYKIPATLKEFTIRQYLKAQEKTDNDLEWISNFAGIPLDELREADKETTKEILYVIYQLRDEYSKTDFLKAKDIQPLKSFRYGKDTFYVPQDIGKQSSGQWFDTCKMMKDLQGQEIAFIPYLLAIYCLKKDENYNWGVSKERAEKFLNLKLLEAYKVSAFFFVNDNDYQNYIRTYFPQAMFLGKRKPQKSRREKTSLKKSMATP